MRFLVPLCEPHLSCCWADSLVTLRFGISVDLGTADLDKIAPPFLRPPDATDVDLCRVPLLRGLHHVQVCTVSSYAFYFAACNLYRGLLGQTL